MRADRRATSQPHRSPASPTEGEALEPEIETLGAGGVRRGLLVVVAIQLGLGIYATHLNRLFYERFGPFFDSVSYLNKLVDLQVAASESGIGGVLRAAIDQTTVFLPWLLFAPFAAWVEPFRATGVWIQVVASTAMSVTLYWYFSSLRRAPVPAAVVFSSAFSFVAATFYFNGGLADFRMDLLQYFLYTTVMVAYLGAHRSFEVRRWVLLGLSIGLLCLARATSPVYLGILFAGLLPFDLLAVRPRGLELAKRWAVATLVALGVAGWFFVVSRKFLHFYYFEWNTAVQARLPLSISRIHLQFALGHVGLPLLIAVTAVASVILATSGRRISWSSASRLNWRPLWFAAVPLTVLVASGAALNPFVSIVGVGGFLLFLLDPLSGGWPLRFRASSAILPVLVGLALAWNAFRGWENHTQADRVWRSIPRRAGLEEIERRLEAEARGSSGRELRYSVVHAGTLNSSVLFNSLAYDRRFRALPRRGVAIGNSTLRGIERPVANATESAWKAMAGETDQARIATEVEAILREIDVVLLVEPGAELPGDVYSNRFVPEVGHQLLASGAWRPISGSIAVSETESIRMFRNDRLARSVRGEPRGSD